MTSINEIGNGLGYLYETEQNGTIKTTRKNNTEGVRDMRQKASVNSPLAANRSAYATIEITGVAATGNFTAVTVNGVNQIAGNVAVTTSDPATEAIALANAINNFTPASGLDYTAFSIGAFVYLVEPSIGGGISNGVTPVVSVSSGTITTTVTPFANGAPATGAYDKQFGRKYYLNSQSDASPDTISGALEITNVITVRSFSSGVETEGVTIASDQIQSFPRYSSIIQLKVDTEGNAGSDNLVFINPSLMVDGDIVVIVGANSAHTVNVISQPNVSLVSPTAGNIFLSNNTQFSTSGLNGGCLMLRYIYDNTYGGIFVEMLRTATSACITPVTYSQMRTLILSNALKQGCRYVITNRADLGIVCTATSTNTLSLTCEGLFLNADYSGTGNYSGVSGFVSQLGVWYVGIVVGAANQVCIYNNNHYLNLTGVTTSTPPPSDGTNWQFIPKSVTTGYHLVSDTIEYDIATYISFSLDYITGRKDCFGNYVHGGVNYIIANDPLSKFAWGNSNHSSNDVFNSTCDANFRGILNNNQLLGESEISNNSGTGRIQYNILNGNSIINNQLTALGGVSYIQYNSFCNISSNILSGSSSIIGNNTNCVISTNTLSGINSIISENNRQRITANILTQGASISGNSGTRQSTNTGLITSNVFTLNGKIINNFNSGVINQNTIRGASGIEDNVLQGNTLTFTFLQVGKIENNILEADSTIRANAIMSSGAIYRKTLSSNISVFGNTITGNYGSEETLTNNILIQPFMNQIAGGRKEVDITGLSAIPVPADYSDLVITSSNATESVYMISYLIGSENRMGRIRFYPAPGLTLTIVYTPVADNLDLRFYGSVASRVLNGDNYDMVEFETGKKNSASIDFLSFNQLFETTFRISI